MATPSRVLVVGDSQEAALRVGADLSACGVLPALFFAACEADLERLAAQSALVVACRAAALPPERVLEILATRSDAPPVLVYSDSFTEGEIVALMRAGARDCIRRGDTERLAEALARETSEGARRAPEGEAIDRYRALIEEIPALTYVAWADDRGSRAYLSPQLVAMTGFTPGEWLAEPDMWMRRLHPEDREGVLQRFREACQTCGRFGAEYRVLDRDGRVVWWRDEGKVLPGPDGEARFVRGFVVDVTEQKLAEESLHKLRYYDQLTGLPNRMLMLRRLGRELSDAMQQGRPLALLILALEQFRDVSNTLGHHNADLIVRELAVRLGDALGDAHRVARLRGDEFGLLLPDADAPFARQVGARVLSALERPFMVQKLPIEVAASVGIAVAPEHGSEAEVLLRRADAAVQAARKVGGGASVLYSPECERFDAGRLALLGELRRAIEGNELQLHYQPKVDLRTHTVVGAEALLRWTHAKRGPVPPGEFIPEAERMGIGLMRPLTRWVLDRALYDARGWLKENWRLPVSVNVSACSLQEERFVDEVLDALLTHDLPGGCLVIEVTETAAMRDTGRAKQVLERLADKGVGISIDDFGTGYTSLALLQNLRGLSELKIDRSFVNDMHGETMEAEAIVRSTAELAHNLGLDVVAEGVENEWTLDQLANFGCDQAQGYFIAKPMPNSALASWLSSARWKAAPAN